MECAGKKDGYYSNGCSSVFVYCSEGVATSMVVFFLTKADFDNVGITFILVQKCPPSLVFNEKNGHCDYVENCSVETPVLPPPPPSMQTPASVYAPSAEK